MKLFDETENKYYELIAYLLLEQDGFSSEKLQKLLSQYMDEEIDFEVVDTLAGEELFVLPEKARIHIIKEKGDCIEEIIYGETRISLEVEVLEHKIDAKLYIKNRGITVKYGTKLKYSLLNPTEKYAHSYAQFAFEYDKKPSDEVESIKQGFLRLYAIEQVNEVYDYTELLTILENTMVVFRAICNAPKSRLKSVNEVRPIETVKRVGYEAISYLASHSEDWLARTASGLKPVRLFSRVEDDDYQIYENCVVKTLIDMIITFLQRIEKGLRHQCEQMQSIIHSGVQTDGFGFDVGFQIAVTELLVMETNTMEVRNKKYQLTEELLNKVHLLLKKYIALRSTRLYRYLKHTKPVANPLKETNILLLDKKYSVIFKLWKSIRKEINTKEVMGESKENVQEVVSYYAKFCKTLCGYVAHILNFECKEDGRYERQQDELEITCSNKEDIVFVTIYDKKMIQCVIENYIVLPITKGEKFESFFYDGESLYWTNTITKEEIERFCSLLKTRSSRGKEQAKEQQNYIKLKQVIEAKQREYKQRQFRRIAIVPMAIELQLQRSLEFRDCIKNDMEQFFQKEEVDYVVIALPRGEEGEIKIVEYAKNLEERILFLPLTMYDINSFRRLQNLFLRLILQLREESCASCGTKYRQIEDYYTCDTCNSFVGKATKKTNIYKTTCAYSDCKHTYTYISPMVSESVLEKMKTISKNNFISYDSMFQYKDVVNMTIQGEQVRAICPKCKRC